MAVLPKTRLHRVRRLLLLCCGHRIHVRAKVNGDLRIYGRGRITVEAGTWVGLGCVFVTHPDAPIHIGSNCDIGPMVAFVTGSHELGGIERRAAAGYSKPIFIGAGTWIGARTSLLAGARVGAGSIVGAGSLVRGANYPDSVLLVGVPASIKRHLDQSGQ